jgi:catechol 2,3-dioxygenase-like lactoylglutathione lyase family enzyme
MEKRVSVITLGVRDLVRSREFYESGLGWSRDSGGDDIAFYQAGCFIVALYEWPKLAEDAGVAEEGSGFRGFTLAHCTRTRDEVDTVLAQAKAAGARILVPARETFWGGYDGYLADPDGHLWEIAWNPAWPITDRGDTLLRAP